MANFAKVLNGKVVTVIVAEPEFFNTFVDASPGEWVQTSYNTHGNVHYGSDGQPDGGVAIRANFAGVGYNYDKENDVFYSESPFPSWVLNKTSWTWEAPIPFPEDGKKHLWIEESQSWSEGF